MTYINRYIASPLKSLAIAVPFLLAGSVAMAQDNGLYAGMSFSRSLGDISPGTLSPTLQANGFALSLLNETDRDNAWKVLAGYDFNRYIATELSYFDLGSYTFNANLLPAKTLNGRAGMTGYGLDVVATVPISERFSGLVRAGVTQSSVKQSFHSSTTSPSGFVNRKDRDAEGKFGVGLQFAVTDAFSVRAEWEQYRLPDNQFTDNRANLATLGVVYRFGRTPAPAPVVQAPAPAPTPAPPAPMPPPAPVSVTLSASALFDFDQATLRPAGRQELDALVRQINGVSYDTVIVIGHTDRIGTR
jgi:OmpA-OmpF porin, OOP family